MGYNKWLAFVEKRNDLNKQRRALEAKFNAEIVRRHRSGETKEQIVSVLGITRELFRRVVQSPAGRR